jgi:hypothetical protein
MSDDVAKGIAGLAIVLALLLGALTFGGTVSSSRIAKDCDTLGKTRISDVVYACQKQQ